MSENLRVAPLSLKAVLTSYTNTLAVFIPLSGWMADRFGSRRIFASSIAFFTAGSLLCGVAGSIPMLVFSRIIQGIGGAMMVPVGRLTLVRSFPRSEMLRVLNYVPFLGGLIVHWLHWRVIFLMNLPLSLAGFILAWRWMPDFRDPAHSRLDLPGFLLLGSGIGLLSYVLEVFGEHRLSPVLMALMLAGSALLLAAALLHSRRTPSPLLRLALFRLRTFRISVFGGWVTRLGVGGMPFLLPLLYQLGLGYAPWQAGLLIMPQAAAALLMRTLNRGILRRLGHRWTLLLNTVLLGGTMVGFTSVLPGTPIVVLIALGFAQGFFSSLQFTSLNTLAFADVDDAAAGGASSIASAVQQLSLSFGVAVASLTVQAFLGPVDQRDPARAIPALHATFLVLGGLTLASSLLFLSLHSEDGGNVSLHEGRGD
jgi:EmrB/QacA subfamily drug resistance transporter